MTRMLPLLAIVAAAAACGRADGGPPRIEVDRTACAHCGMLVSEPVYAAAYRAPGAEARVFDDIACLLRAAAAEEPRQALTFWFHDADTREWIAGDEAIFVRSSALPTPMSGGLIAFRDPAAARRAAEAHQGEVVASLPDLLAGVPHSRKDGER